VWREDEESKGKLNEPGRRYEKNSGGKPPSCRYRVQGIVPLFSSVKKIFPLFALGVCILEPFLHRVYTVRDVGLFYNIF
jgi:hypothetical protein